MNILGFSGFLKTFVVKKHSSFNCVSNIKTVVGLWFYTIKNTNTLKVKKMNETTIILESYM